jgi:probable rRNA maturation factor
MTLTISNRQRTRKINVRMLKEISATLLAELAGPEAILEINLVSPAQMAKVNQDFLQHEGPTDVITFDYREDASVTGINGELFICPEVAVTQSKEFGTDWRSELARYVIHGLLHLSGHDDLEPIARRQMKRVEGRMLTNISRRFDLRKLGNRSKLDHGKEKSPRALAG